MPWLVALLVLAAPAASTGREQAPTPVQISFWSEQAGLLVLDGGTVSVTRDGGRTFRVVRRFDGDTAVSVVRGTGVAFAATADGLFRSGDFGARWLRVAQRRVRDPSFVSRHVGWAVTGTWETSERILSTRDGGRTWSALRGPCAPMTSIHVARATSTRGWAVCSSQPGAGQQPKEVWSTRDAGATWRLVNRVSPFAKSVGRGLCICGYPRGIAMTAGGTGWLWMARGSFYRTTDGGSTWSSLPISSPEIVEGRSASLLTARVGYVLFGHRPALRFTRDGGRTWTVVRRWSR